MQKLSINLFFLHLVTRFLFILVIGFFNNYRLQADSYWLVELGMQASRLDFNFELDRFVVSPLFPMIIGFLKIIFGEVWNVALIIIQLLLSALSGVYIYKIAFQLFNNKKTGIIASLLFSIYPMTLWFTNTFSQECIFQSLFIFSIYFLLKSIKSSNIYYVIISSILFSLAYLTKSHILLFSIFIPLIYFHHYKFKKQTFIYSITFAIISLLFSVPYGLHTYKTHDSYIISSNGAGFQFYLGNSEAGYKTVVDVPSKNSDDYKRMKLITASAGYFSGSQSMYDSILSLPQKEKQTAFFYEGVDWIKNNPQKFLKLKLYDTMFFLVPGVSWRHYSFWNWMFSFLVSFPIYLLSYISIISLIRKKDLAVIPIVYIFISMFLFSTVWYVQNRFRTITLEPFLVIYASYTIMLIIEKKIPAVNRLLAKLTRE